MAMVMMVTVMVTSNAAPLRPVRLTEEGEALDLIDALSPPGVFCFRLVLGSQVVQPFLRMFSGCSM